MERNRVLVSGLPGDEVLSRCDLLIYFQSKKKSGGGEISHIDVLEQGKAIITFEDGSVVRDVLAKEHIINGIRIQATIPRSCTKGKTRSSVNVETSSSSSSEESSNEEVEDDEDRCCVFVKNLPAGATQDSIQYYFEKKSKKFKGGPVKKVDLKASSNSAVVMFQLEEDAKRVVDYKKHKLKGERLDVSLMDSGLKSVPGEEKIIPYRENPEKQSESPFEFIVSGIKNISSEESLKQYLENTRRSGGGEVKFLKIHKEKDIAELKLHSVKDLDHLIYRRHIVEGSEITVNIKTLENEVPMDPLKVQVKGLSPKTKSTDCIRFYMEKMSNIDVGGVQLGECGNALVSFDSAPDFDELFTKISSDKKGIEDHRITVERVPYCNCVQVSGLSRKISEEDLKLYFESPSRGCGTLPSKIELHEEGKALVYFEDPSVIDKALKKPLHGIKDEKWKVELFYPFLNKAILPNQTCTKIQEVAEIKIDPAVFAHIDKNYQDRLQDLQDETNIKLVWTIDESSVKMEEKGASKQPWDKRVHVLQTFFDTFGCVTIDVEPSDWSEVLEVLQNETSAKIFNDISVRTNDSTNQIKMTGKKNCVQMAENVVDLWIGKIKEEKVSQEKRSDVSLKDPSETVLPQEGRKLESHNANFEKQNAPPLDFFVTGIKSLSADLLRHYMENTRRSGGGKVEVRSFCKEKDIAEIKFHSVKDLDLLLLGNHVIEGYTITVKAKVLEHELPMDPLKVQIKGLSPKTTSIDCIRFYMEKMSDTEVTGVQLGECGNALISFESPPDFDKLFTNIFNDKDGIEDCSITVEHVPYCNCIQVSGLSNKITEDDINLYFDGQTRGCGVQPSKIERQEEGKALVYFNDPSVIDRALEKSQHVFKGDEWKLESYYPFLKEDISHKEECKKTQEIREIEKESDVMAYITYNCPNKLQELLDNSNIELEWTPEETSVRIKRKESATDKNEPWEKRVKDLETFLDTFESVTIDVDPSLWSEVLEVIEKKGSINDTEVMTYNSTNKIKITGKKSCLQTTINEVRMWIDEIKEDKALQESVVTVVEKDIAMGKLALLQISDVYEHLQGMSKHVKIDINEEKGEIIINSPKNVLKDISMEIFKYFTKIEEDVLELPERVLKVLQTPRGCDFVTSALLEKEIHAVLVHGQRKSVNEASIFAVNKDQAKQASTLIQSFTSERSIYLSDEKILVIKSHKWNNLVSDLKNRLMVDILFEQKARTLWISGIESDTSECLKKVEKYFTTNTILKDDVEFTKGCSRLVFQRFANEIKKIQDDVSDCFLTIQPTDGGEILLTGTQEGIEKGKESLTELVESICEEEIKVDKPGMRNFFKSSQGLKNIKFIETENKCAIEFVDLDDLITCESDSLSNGDIICSYTTKEVKKLIVYKNDLTKHKVDVIVNPANENLKHSEGLAAAVVRVGGKEIQDECDRFTTKSGPLLEGHVLETGPGHLPCKLILHAVGPQRDNKMTKKENLLRLAFKNCLDKAKDFQSMAIPAVGTVMFGFPLYQCATILIETVVAFFQKNPHCNLSEVHLTSNDDLTVNAFSTGMKNKFGREPNYIEGKTKSLSFVSKSILKASSRSTTEDKAVTTPQGLAIFVKIADIAQEEAGVLVNTVGEDLNLQQNACARSFSNAAGPKLQEHCKKIAPVKVGEIGITQPGKLKCQHVFHAVSSEWSNGSGESVLRGILKRCLSEADKRGVSSIAIPAIGTGVLKFPRDVVARVSFEEVFLFSKTKPSNLRKVTFVVYDKDQPTVQAFEKEKSDRLPSSIYVKTKKAKKALAKRKSSLRKIKENWFEFELDDVSVQVQSGDITKESTDAIVVVSDPDLDIENKGGATGAAILKAGGDAIKRECQQHPTMKSGDVAMTTGGSLDVKKLIHYVRPDPFDKAKLTKAVIDCLKTAEKEGLKSISFPSIGTGNLGISSHDCAKAMLRAAREFCNKKPTAIKSIRIIIYQESMINDFYLQMKEFVGEPKISKTMHSLVRKRNENWFEIEVDNVTVQVQSGDITKESTDAIVVVSNSDLDIENKGGATGAAILKAGGDAIKNECQQHPTIKSGELAMTTGGNLAVEKLIHYVLPDNFDKAKLTKAVVDCLKTAEKEGLKSISFPSIGTGNLGISSHDCAKAMLMAAQEFSKQNPTTTQLMRIVIYQEAMIKEFHSQMKEFVGESETSDNTGYFRKFTNFLGFTKEKEEVEIESYESPSFFIHVYSGHPNELSAAVKAVEDIINETSNRQEIEKESIAYLEASHIKGIGEVGRSLDCEIKVKKSDNLITVDGNTEDAIKAKVAVLEILDDADRERNEADALAKEIQWKYETEDEFVPFNNSLNAKIETAYSEKKTHFIFEYEDEDFTINFSRMVLENDETKVIRKTNSVNDVPLPDYWDPQPKDSSGTADKTVHLVEILSDKHPKEYQKVSDLFNKTLSGKNSIKKIQRVQNPSEYKLYVVRKQKMDEKNGSTNNERMLFHGTAPQNCESINYTGFNKNYQGKNATFFGRGVYFAVNAEYSAQKKFSPPDSHGNRYMYLARVLTGTYTKGAEGMAVPPPKDEKKPTVTYDSVVNDVSNPEIFVVFYDAQCYHEYLITFQ